MTRDLMALSRQVGAALIERGETVCAAESCTGGLILSSLTDRAGSSAYVAGGVVSYSNEAKMRLLGVCETTLIAHGAVSEETAAEMARGALALFDTDYALSVTGIAGPGGGTAEKPVGLTYIGLAGPQGSLQVAPHVWDSDRIGNKAASVEAAFNLLLDALRD
ncbi:MAG: CinA family protein [Chloroflexota bacterium]|nr:CinA family protein [Chloroflexota bacterium]MDE2909515.1 CinA family protein [Chloroflexota bacterium]